MSEPKEARKIAVASGPQSSHIHGAMQGIMHPIMVAEGLWLSTRLSQPQGLQLAALLEGH